MKRQLQDMMHIWWTGESLSWMSRAGPRVMVGEAWEGSGRILWKFWRKARSQSGQNFIFFWNSRIPYPDGNQIFKINAVILSQIVLLLEKKIAKNRPDMEVWTIFSGKSWGGQVKSGQISGAAVRTKGAFSGSGLPYHYPGSSELLMSLLFPDSRQIRLVP